MTELPAISVVTPSYQQPAWLRLCAASVADQNTPSLCVEHIVQDACSGPEVAEIISAFPPAILVSEKDDGMYDAITRGWARATGNIFCWLNCDEQYLPGALAEVAQYFAAHPETEVLFANAIVVNGDGDYLCSRQVVRPHLYHTWTCHLHTLSCAMFFRSNLFRERGFALDARWKDAGDGALVVEMIRAGVRMDCLKRYTSAFVDNGKNRGLRRNAIQEHETLMRMAPRWAQAACPVWKILHRLRRLADGHYSPKPLAYDIYTPTSPTERAHFDVLRPSFYWAARM